MRLIDADALIEDLDKKSSYDLVCFDIELLGIIKDQPTIEVAPVVQGKVVTVFENAIGHQRCSVCGSELEWKAYPNYCDNCGAKLKGGA